MPYIPSERIFRVVRVESTAFSFMNNARLGRSMDLYLFITQVVSIYCAASAGTKSSTRGDIHSFQVPTMSRDE